MNEPMINGHNHGLVEIPFPPWPTPGQQQKLVDDWNGTFSVGQKVHVKLDNGSVLNSFTKSEAWLLGGHTAVIMVDGISGAYSLSRITACVAAA